MNPGTPANFRLKGILEQQQKFTGSFKTEISEKSWKEGEDDTRNTSQEYEKLEVPKSEYDRSNLKVIDRDSRLDSSFLYADIDLGEKKETAKDEKRVSERMTTRVYRTIASNFKKLFSSSKSYGWNWGRAQNPDLEWWARAEEWLKYAFQSSSKAFSEKDQKVFRELMEVEVKKDSKGESDDDDRIPLTGKFDVFIE